MPSDPVSATGLPTIDEIEGILCVPKGGPVKRLLRWMGGKLQDWGVVLNEWSWR